MTDSSTEIVDAEVEEETQPEGQVEAAIDDTDEATDEALAKSQEVARSIQRLDLSLSGDIDPNDLTPAQKAAIAAILNFSPTEPGAWGNILAFMHNCVRRGLDPFNREAYLIARGKGDNRKYTMQTGIDGFLITAARTGRFIRVKHRLWTGTGDEQSDWYRDPETGIMQRVWYDQWPASRGYPGAAKAVIEHYDERGQIVTTEWVSDWDMYCPTVDEWVNTPNGRRKTGKSEPTEMWKKGGPMMLAKTAIAGALRSALPGGVNGLYIHEELHRADQDEKVRIAAESRQRLVERAAARVAKPVPEDEQTAEPEQPADEALSGSEGPLLPVGEPEQAEQTADEQTADEQTADEHAETVAADEQALHMLRAEAEWQAQALGVSLPELFRRQVEAFGVATPAELDSEALAGVVFQNRAKVVRALRKNGHEDLAERYGVDVGSTRLVDVRALAL